jgi:hypothetical protein
MEISISITVPFFGLQLRAEIDGTYTHDTFEPTAVYLWHVTEPDEGRLTYIHTFLPTPADVSDFYSAHAAAIDEAVRAELADHAEAASDTYEAQRQDEIDDAAERLRA